MTKVHGAMKLMLQKFLSMSKVHLMRIKSVVTDILRRILGNTKVRREIGICNLFSKDIKNIPNRTFNK